MSSKKSAVESAFHTYCRTLLASIRKYLRIALIYGYLLFLLWSTLLRPGIDIDARWVPKTFFTSAKQITCIIRMHHKPLALLEAGFFSLIAVFGYFRGCGGVAALDRNIYGKTLATFEQAMMGVRQKYYWICLTPWIVTFTQNWLHNMGQFLLLFSDYEVYAAHNVYSAMILLLSSFMVQILLASEVFFMALYGWCAMKNINEENVEWERKKKSFFGMDILDSVFGTARK
ncbi:unnamed protein product [Ceratitis capitata]|uniref:(Mediterranean fruit fly) hypothetical protein n=1 Tax=Ceratitis capitata TaxID=7213 RepID=W8C9S9_CERCA|nr:unnamed protein product [Ceratitis capitata]